MSKADEIRKEIKLKRKQLGYHAGFVKNKMADLLFREIIALNQKLSIEIEKDTNNSVGEFFSERKSFDKDEKEIDDKQRLRDLTS